MSTKLEIRLYDALKRIVSYHLPTHLHRVAQKKYGLSPEEAIEYAYENVLMEAAHAIKGVRIRGDATSAAPGSPRSARARSTADFGKETSNG